MTDQTDLAYFVLALRMAADEYDSDVLRALAKDAGKIKRRIATLETLLQTIYADVVWNNGAACIVCGGRFDGARYQHKSGCTVRLIERELPELPTRAGSEVDRGRGSR